MNKMDGMSMNLIGENVEQLKRLFPEAVTEGKIDFEVLKALLGGEIETRQEYYKFTWNGKEAARAYARTRSMGTLRPCVEESSGKDGTPGKFDSENLYKCYLNSLNLARANDVHSIAFPCISTGVYGYPKDKAAQVSSKAAVDWIKSNSDYDMEIIFCCFDDRSCGLYKEILNV